MFNPFELVLPSFNLTVFEFILVFVLELELGEIELLLVLLGLLVLLSECSIFNPLVKLFSKMFSLFNRILTLTIIEYYQYFYYLSYFVKDIFVIHQTIKNVKDCLS